jgi:hypothetical protein
MFKIEVDLSQFNEIYDELEPNLGMLQQGIVNATQYIRDVWVSAVQGSVLPGMVRSVTDDVYARSLSTGESMKFPEFLYGIVMPVNHDDIVDRIEDGYGAFDMKPGLLNGPKSRPTADGKGRFNTVPMRHLTPQKSGAGGISVQMRMPNEVYAAAKKLGRSSQGGQGNMDWGDSLNWDQLPASSWNGYTHQSNIYQGMYRVGSDKHTQYLTFRRVSSQRTVKTRNGTKTIGSAANSWIHLGVSPNPVIEAVYNFCMPEVERNLLEIAEKAFGAS